MFDQFIGDIILQLIKREIIVKVDVETYFFGIKTMFIQAVHILLVIILGFCVDLLLESILFLLAYLPLRVSAGGYHAPNNKWCFAITIFMETIVLMIIQYLPMNLILPAFVISCLTAVPLLFRYAPVENIKKPLDMREKRIYATRTHWILAMIIVGISIAFFMRRPNLALVLILSLLAESVMISASLMQDKRLFHKNEEDKVTR